MNILQIIINFAISTFFSFALLFYLFRQIKLSDSKSGLHIISNKCKKIIFSCLMFSSITVSFYFKDTISTILYSLMFSILTIHAYTDYKQKIVYRPFNYVLWIIGFVNLAYNILSNRIPLLDMNKETTAIYIGGFILIIYLMIFVFKMSGKGDGYILIGLSLFLPFINTTRSLSTIVFLLLYYILAGIIQIIINIRKIDIKKLRFKEKLPFAPAMLASGWLVFFLMFLYNFYFYSYF